MNLGEQKQIFQPQKIFNIQLSYLIEMQINDDLKQEITENLKTVFPSSGEGRVNKFQKLLGADTETFSFSYSTNEGTIPLIFRLYRNVSDRAENEFKTLQALATAGISVPKPYLWKKTSHAVSRSFLIMEFISGELLSDYLLKTDSKTKRMDGFHRFIQEMVNIHRYDWASVFIDSSSIAIPNIESNPFIYVDNLIKYPKEMIDIHDINDLKPLVYWLEINKIKTEKLSLLHGDYHMNNIIITPQKKLVVLDWADLKIGDFRHDLAFAIVATSSAGVDVMDIFTGLYQKCSNFKVINIEYYMILSILYNLLRCYSALINPQITGETETTKETFLTTYNAYTEYLTKIVKRIAGVSLPILEEAVLSRK
jgi:aminoglycoside phosphotransferase (APT) family kinase protein